MYARRVYSVTWWVGCGTVDAMTTTRFVWLLDIDGVINASAPRWPKSVEGKATADGRIYTIRWAPALIDGIIALVDRHDIDLRLCSTWCDDAAAITECIGLPMEPAFTGLTTRYSADAKHCAAQAVLSDGAHLIWTDDAEIPSAWSHPRALDGRPDGRD